MSKVTVCIWKWWHHTFNGGAVLWHHIAGQRWQRNCHKHHQQTGDLILLLWADVLCAERTESDIVDFTHLLKWCHFYHLWRQTVCSQNEQSIDWQDVNLGLSFNSCLGVLRVVFDIHPPAQTNIEIHGDCQVYYCKEIKYFSSDVAWTPPQCF